MFIKPALKLSGQLSFRGDKSISHRIVLLAALNRGSIAATNLATGDDVTSSIAAIKQLGVTVTSKGSTTTFTNPGNSGTSTGTVEICCGNSGTTARLLAGILAAKEGHYRLTGDHSLSSRPMRRIIEPLTAMGAVITATDNDHLPIDISGQRSLTPIHFANKLSSAQVKSAVLLAALSANGRTTISEAIPSRDHTERLFSCLNLPVSFSDGEISLRAPCSIAGNFSFSIPGDISSAAFFITAAAMIPGSSLLLSDVLLNPGRIAFIDVLKRMGANIKIMPEQNTWEPAGNIFVTGSSLRGTTILPKEIPALIDEIPALAVAMAFSAGESRVTGAKELRHKESDRIKALIEGFTKAGIKCEELPDGFIIAGSSKIDNITELDAKGDHRLAMAMTLVGIKSARGLYIKDHDCAAISCPDFFTMLEKISE